MKHSVFFIDTKFSKYLVAAKQIRQYVIDNIKDISVKYPKTIDISTKITKFTKNVLFIRSDLIGITKSFLDDLIKYKDNKKILISTLNNEACIIIIDTDIYKSKLSILESHDFDSLIMLINKQIQNDNDLKEQLKYYTVKSNKLSLLNNSQSITSFELKVQKILRKNAIKHGVYMKDPNTTYISFDTKFGSGVLIEPNVFFGEGVHIHDNVHIKAFSYLEKVEIKHEVSIGPFSRIRGNSKIEQKVKIGNFTEIKNSELDIGTKIPHLSYVGDTKIGKNVNIGAGTITCNYDGVKKHKTIIQDNVFIGSNSVLIAPINIGNGSIIGASSFINHDVPENSFAIGRSKQIIKPNKK